MSPCSAHQIIGEFKYCDDPEFGLCANDIILDDSQDIETYIWRQPNAGEK